MKSLISFININLYLVNFHLLLTFTDVNIFILLVLKKKKKAQEFASCAFLSSCYKT